MEGISQIFESEKGKKTCEIVTICEAHKRIFDRVVIALKDDPKALKPIVKDLEVAFLLGVKMNIRLCERRVDAIDDIYDLAPDFKERQDLRYERERLASMITRQRSWLEDNMDH